MKNLALSSTAILFLSMQAMAASPIQLSVPAGSCDSVNQALQSLPAEGGTVVLQSGLYTCQSPIIIDRDNITLRGAGSTKTLIRTADGKAMPTVIIGEARKLVRDQNGTPYPDHITHNVNLSGVAIDGNYHNHVNPGNFECYNPKTQGSLSCGDDPGFYIRNNSLTIRASEHVRVTDVATSGAFSGGIVLEKHNNDIVMDGFSARDNWFDGFAGYETSNSVFRNFMVEKNVFSGLSLDLSFEGNIFEKGEASNNGDNGIFSMHVGRNVFRDIKAFNNKTYGFFIDGTRDQVTKAMVAHTCDGNQIINVEISGPREGAFIANECASTVISGAKIQQPALKCVEFNPQAQVAVSNSSCTDGKQTVSLDSKSQN